MRKPIVTWVVYEKLIHGKPSGMNAVCEQSEWDAMEVTQPGIHTLIRAGITNEGEAEKLARYGPSGIPVPVIAPPKRVKKPIVVTP